MKYLLFGSVFILSGCIDNSNLDTNFERSSVTYYNDRVVYGENAKKLVTVNGRTSIVNAN